MIQFKITTKTSRKICPTLDFVINELDKYLFNTGKQFNTNLLISFIWKGNTVSWSLWFLSLLSIVNVYIKDWREVS